MPPVPTGLPNWPYRLGEPRISGRIRAEAEDFRVVEEPLIEPDGEGSHLWLEVEKRNANTEWVARQLAACAGVPAREVGFAGMKDRRAVTRQWFSVALQEAGNRDWPSWSVADARILRASLHRRKLRRGALRGNRFRLVVRDLRGDAADLENRLWQVAGEGVPNYFGPQRFGHGGRNLEHGVRWLQQDGRLPRQRRSLYLSAVRSFLFNTVLARRLEAGTWNRILDGETAVLDGSRSTFACTMPDPELERRCAEFDIHPSGPLPGRGPVRLRGEAAAVEAEALEPHRGLSDSLEKAGLDAARRSLRIVPGGMAWAVEVDQAVLEFRLPPGAYATSVLRELVSTASGTISDSQ